ncbi:hypothetical protein KHS38_20745 [Mucilaginibacter sp. Bleaf8]|uniref:DUF6934 family protein n=1 Tax=Mucilaginibacter sp. Bleaf8 TaxID=2834430 RepID=UPI001BCD73DE|nr:hypothetical protein [Mucilaginibacter sp. Bleaf8]MBS7566846.1 hypothetical protein [Mucilaginibacter sp. Bleaf8]
MHLDRYYTVTEDYQEYEFFSEGPKGRIKKSVRFIKINDDPIVYNLAFGDVDPATGKVSDLTTTDNKDREKVLATVAGTIHTFCNHYGNHYIYAEGSTSARTRLYQMSIARLWDDISKDFVVYGIKNGLPYEFELNVNYEGFLVKRR